MINFENCQLNPKENKIINLPKSDFQNNYSNKYNDIYQEEQIFQNYNFQNNPYTTQNNSIKNNLLKNSKNSSEKFNDFEESYFSQNENYLNLNSNKINYFPTNKLNEKSKNLEAEKFNFQTQNDLRDFKSINEVFENPDKLRNNLNKKVKNKFLTINNFKYNSDFNKNKENFITIEEGNFSEKNILDDTNTKENTNANTTCSESPIFNKNKKSFDLKSNKIHIETEFKELKNINYDNITILKDLQENVNKKDRRENIFENIEKKEEFISTEIPKRNIQETNINKKIIQENSTKKLLIKFDLNSITNNNDNNNTLLYSQNEDKNPGFSFNKWNIPNKNEIKPILKNMNNSDKIKNNDQNIVKNCINNGIPNNKMKNYDLSQNKFSSNNHNSNILLNFPNVKPENLNFQINQMNQNGNNNLNFPIFHYTQTPVIVNNNVTNINYNKLIPNKLNPDFKNFQKNNINYGNIINQNENFYDLNNQGRFTNINNNPNQQVFNNFNNMNFFRNNNQQNFEDINNHNKNFSFNPQEFTNPNIFHNNFIKRPNEKLPVNNNNLFSHDIIFQPNFPNPNSNTNNNIINNYFNYYISDKNENFNNINFQKDSCLINKNINYHEYYGENNYENLNLHFDSIKNEKEFINHNNLRNQKVKSEINNQTRNNYENKEFLNLNKNNININDPNLFSFEKGNLNKNKFQNISNFEIYPEKYDNKNNKPIERVELYIQNEINEFENIEILKVNFTLGNEYQKNNYIFILCKSDNFFESFKKFCEENKIPQNSEISLIFVIFQALSSIFQINNSKISKFDENYLEILKNNWKNFCLQISQKNLLDIYIKKEKNKTSAANKIIYDTTNNSKNNPDDKINCKPTISNIIFDEEKLKNVNYKNNPKNFFSESEKYENSFPEIIENINKSNEDNNNLNKYYESDEDNFNNSYFTDFSISDDENDVFFPYKFSECEDLNITF